MKPFTICVCAWLSICMCASCLCHFFYSNGDINTKSWWSWAIFSSTLIIHFLLSLLDMNNFLSFLSQLKGEVTYELKDQAYCYVIMEVPKDICSLATWLTKWLSEVESCKVTLFINNGSLIFLHVPPKMQFFLLSCFSSLTLYPRAGFKMKGGHPCLNVMRIFIIGRVSLNLRRIVRTVPTQCHTHLF